MNACRTLHLTQTHSHKLAFKMLLITKYNSNEIACNIQRDTRRMEDGIELHKT